MVSFLFLVGLVNPPVQVTADKLDGKWSVTSALTGNAETDRLFLSRTLVFAGDKLKILKDDGQTEGEFMFILRPTKTPKEIDLHVDRKRGEKLTILGIYALDGNRLKLAWSPRRDVAVRPQDFVGGGVNEIRVFELHRKK